MGKVSGIRNVRNWVIGVFVTLYAYVATWSTVHSVDFFALSNPHWMAVALAIAFEIGSAACLAGIVVLDKSTRWLVWTLFCLVTGVQICGNLYYAYAHLADYRLWSELFGMVDQEPILQKRVISFITGGILPLVALGFIKVLVGVVRPEKPAPDLILDENLREVPQPEAPPVAPVAVPEPPPTTGEILEAVDEIHTQTASEQSAPEPFIRRGGL